MDDHDQVGQQPVEHAALSSSARVPRPSTTLEAVRGRRVLLLVAAAVAYAWWVAGLRAFTWPALVAVGVAGAAAIVAGTRGRRPPARLPRGTLVWAVLLALLAGWELAAYLQSPRADHPTLSSLADPVLDWRPARALAFLGWFALGVDLARR